MFTRENHRKKALAPKAGVKKAGSAFNDVDETPEQPISAGLAN